MNDDKKASEYNIEGGSVLHLVLALRGGRMQVPGRAALKDILEYSKRRTELH